MVYLIDYNLCKDQYIGSAYKNNFKPRFVVHKSEINTGKYSCGVVKHFSTQCTDVDKIGNIEVHLVERVEEGDLNVEGKLWCKGKYLPIGKPTLLHGMNSTWDWYRPYGKGCRK